MKKKKKRQYLNILWRYHRNKYGWRGWRKEGRNVCEIVAFMVLKQENEHGRQRGKHIMTTKSD